MRDTNRDTARDLGRDSEDSFGSDRSDRTSRDSDRYSSDRSSRDSDRYSTGRDSDQYGSDRQSDRYSSDRDDRQNYTRDSDRRSTTRDTDSEYGRNSSRDVARDDWQSDSRASRADYRDSDRYSGARRDASRASYSSNSYSSVDVNTFRAADIGLWFNTGARGSLVISDVATSGPIARLGFEEGDRIVEVHGQRVRSEREFVRYLLDEEIRDERVEVVVIRDGQEEVVYVEPSVLIQETHVAQHDPLEEVGIVIDDRYDDRVVVWKVLPRTPAYYAGVRPGDVITTWHGRRISRPDSFVQVVTQSDPGEVAIGVRRENRVRDLQIDVPEFQAQATTGRQTSFRPDFDDNLDDRLDRREDRREFREERREDRFENRQDNNYGAGFGAGADVNIGTPGAGVRINRPGYAPGYNAPGSGIQVQTPAGDINVDTNRSGGGILPRFRNR